MDQLNQSDLVQRAILKDLDMIFHQMILKEAYELNILTEEQYADYINDTIHILNS